MTKKILAVVDSHSGMILKRYLTSAPGSRFAAEHAARKYNTTCGEIRYIVLEMSDPYHLRLVAA